MDCRLYPKVAVILDHITQNPSDAQDARQQYCKAQQPANRRAMRDKVIKVLQGRIQQGNLDSDDDIADIADQLTYEYWPDTN